MTLENSFSNTPERLLNWKRTNCVFQFIKFPKLLIRNAFVSGYVEVSGK